MLAMTTKSEPKKTPIEKARETRARNVEARHREEASRQTAMHQEDLVKLEALIPDLQEQYAIALASACKGKKDYKTEKWKGVEQLQGRIIRALAKARYIKNELEKS